MDGFVHVMVLIMILLAESEKDLRLKIWKYQSMNLLIVTQLRLGNN